MTTAAAHLPDLAESMLETEKAVGLQGDIGRLQDVLRHTACRITPARQIYGRDDIVSATLADHARWRLCGDAAAFASPGIGHGTLVAIRTSTTDTDQEAADHKRHTLVLQEVLDRRISREWRVSVAEGGDRQSSAQASAPSPPENACPQRAYWHWPPGSPMSASAQTSPAALLVKQPGQAAWAGAAIGEYFALLNARRFAQLARRYRSEAEIASHLGRGATGLDGHFSALRDMLVKLGDARFLPFRFAAEGSHDEYRMLVLWMMWGHHGAVRLMGASWIEATRGLIQRDWMLLSCDGITRESAL